MGLPQGTVTFLFTDLEGSTRRWEAHPAEMRDALARHNAIVRGVIESHNGVVFSTMGDGMAAVFASARDAVRAVLAAQVGLAAEDWGQVTGPLAARMGLLTDEGVLGGEHYLNQPLNRCARLMAAGHGGQALVSGATELVATPEPRLGPTQRVRPGDLDTGGLGELMQAAGGRVPVHPGAAAVEQDRSAGAVPDCPVDGPPHRWR